MLRTNLQAKWGLVRDVRPVVDPWGLGITFEVKRIDCEDYQAWAKRRQQESPIFAAMLKAQGRAMLRAMAEKRKLTDDDTRSAMLEAADVVEFRPEDFEATIANAREGTAKLLAGWSGLTDLEGRPVPFSEETALELLRSRELVEEGAPYGGKTLGEALHLFIQEAAIESAGFREAYMEGASGN